MNIVILGAAGFIGTNLTIELAKNTLNRITLVDKNRLYFSQDVLADNVEIVESDLSLNMDQQHLISTSHRI